MMKILFDHQIFQNQKFGGISRYFVELITNLGSDISFEIGLKYTNNNHLIERLNIPLEPLEDFKVKFLKDKNIFVNKQLTKLYSRLFPDFVKDCYKENLMTSLSLIQKEDYDIFHPTYCSTYFLDYIRKPFVITVHDLIYELFPEFYSPADKALQHKKTLIEKSNHIIAVSNKTKSDLIKYYGIDDSKITVIYHGSTHFDQIETINFRLPEKYLLYVGERKGYKNFYFMLNTLSDVFLKYDISLFCAGPSFTSDEKAMIETLNLGGRIYHHYVHENELSVLYRKALAFIFPSLYEGFGMPILEAFSCNCPVLLSDSSCFPEIAGDAALYFDPKSKEDICRQVERVALDTGIRQSLIKKGSDRMKLFSWADTATKTADVYHKVLSV
jgi:glycosyltransferase involved in cell wall biosynthesis